MSCLYNITPAVKYYQLGLEKGEAVKLGANPMEFDWLEGKYKGRSLTTPELYDFKPSKRNR